jgi:hypothetical protein
VVRGNLNGSIRVIRAGGARQGCCCCRWAAPFAGCLLAAVRVRRVLLLHVLQEVK